MSSLAADVTFDFTFPQCHPATTPPPATFYDYDASFDKSSGSLLEVPYYGASRAGHGHGHGHARSSSNCSAYSSYSAYSFASTPSEQSYLSVPSVTATPLLHHTPAAAASASASASASPARSQSQIRTHGPLLLPKIRSQDQALAGDDDNSGLLPAPPLKRARTSPAPSRPLSRTPSLPPRNRRSASASARRSTLGTAKYASSGPAASRHQPSQSLSQSFSQSSSQFGMSTPNRASTPSSVFEATPPPPSLLCSGLDGKFDYDYAFAPYPGTIPAEFLGAAQWQYPQQALYSQSQTRAASPLSVASASPPPEPVVSISQASLSQAPQVQISQTPQTTSLVSYLSQQNPAPALVRTISYPLRDPNTKHYWWDVRQVRTWSAFSASSLTGLPGADAVLSCSVPLSLLPTPALARTALHPETESDLHALCAAHYLPRVNAALALSSPHPHTRRALCGRPTARVVGLVKSFDRFNTGMRAEGGATNNIKKVEYLRGLAHLHFLMREHSCRYGFILTEIELVVVRSGTEATPLFGQMEVARVPLAALGSDADLAKTRLTANLALWGLCMLASDEMAAAAQQSSDASLLCSHSTHIGAPAEGTRRKAAERDAWMPPPQLAEKRAAKRARGWVMPEDAVGRKEMGRRGVKY
ncbi:sialidase-like protein [Ophiostoma piceae UAMH 11346]|uniref:Sialidase-like protein n=1 Tax=Ophiostoma piceae (strain UAMH 11346) TaxID=1262450 RepID=S3CBD6_OPHP1|nr:sialidase-like protein [Ophiostoma piceae UAMH 11346]